MNRHARTALVTSPIVLLFGLACSDGRDGVTHGERSVRVFDHLAEAEIADAPDRTPSHGRSSRLLPLPQRRLLTRVARSGAGDEAEERLCLALQPGSTARFPLTLPQAPELRVGVAALGDELTPPLRRAAVWIGIDGADGQRRILAQEAVGPDDGWIDLTLDLADRSGESVTLVLEAVGPEGPAVAWASPIVVAGASSRVDSPNVLLISLDTLRADHLGSYGYERATSPFLDALAARSWRFAEALSHSPWTRPSHRALLTGLYPQSHGDRRPSYLAETLWRAGYYTEAWTGGGQVDFTLGFGRGFDRYKVDDWLRSRESWVERLSTLRGRHPWFLFLHTYEIHDPYADTRFAKALPGGRLDRYFDQAIWRGLGALTEEEKRYAEALYDGGIASADERLRDLFEVFESQRLLENTIVIVTSDHGEEFWEHGAWRHGHSVYQHQLRVPLLFRIPEALARSRAVATTGVVEDAVRLIDVLPTVLELVGLPRDPSIQGRSLLPWLRGDRLPPTPSLAEDVGPQSRESKSLTLGRYKVIRTQYFEEANRTAVEHYDLALDPSESHDVALDRLPELVRVEEALARLAGSDWSVGRGGGEDDPDAGAEELDPRLRRRLRALGYVN